MKIDRRNLLKSSACGFGYLAAASMAARDANATGANPLAAKPTHFPPRAKRVIFVFMQGGPSHVDTFDYKPLLEKHDGEEKTFDDARVLAKTKQITKHRVFKSPWKFKQYGECGQHVSELFPHIAKRVDDLCFLKGMHTNGVAHGPATLFLHTGSINFVRPSVGSWVQYGLGSESENLPGFVTLQPSMGNGGPRNYGNAFLPAVYQGTAVGRAGVSATDARIRNLSNPVLNPEQQARQFDALQKLNAIQNHSNAGDTELDALINSYELAWRMQRSVPDILDLSSESRHVQEMYGIGEKETDDFGRQCLMARRLSEAGVRYIQVNYGDNTNNPRWDQHSNLEKHADHAVRVDKPIAGLIADLKDTLRTGKWNWS